MSKTLLIAALCLLILSVRLYNISLKYSIPAGELFMPVFFSVLLGMWVMLGFARAVKGGTDV